MKWTLLLLCALLTVAFGHRGRGGLQDLNCPRSLLPWATDNLTGAQVHIDVIANGHQEVFTCAEGQKMIDVNGQEVEIPFELTCRDGTFTSNGPPVNPDFAKLRCIDI